MNFLGKLLITLTLVMSVLLLAVGLAVNRSHRDWKADADSLREQVNEARGRYDNLVEQHRQLDRQLRREQLAALHQLVKLEREYTALQQRNDTMGEEIQELKQEHADATTRVAEAQQNNIQLAEDVSQLRTDIDENNAARQQAFADALDATESLHQLHGQLQATLERRRDLREDLGQDL